MEPEYDWDRKIDYLAETRGLYYNDDYIEFLVHSVWRIRKPVSVIDFGCGYGFLGLKLLPLLPEGSTYTGIDKGVRLIEAARSKFERHRHSAEFLVADIEEVRLERKYDIALCHAVLLHMSDVKSVLRKMADCVVDGGKVICFEPHWISNMSGCTVGGLEQSSVVKLGILQQLYEKDAERSGKDGNIGGKLPIYFSQLGLQDVQCRISDKVNVLEPNMAAEHKQKLYKALRAEGLGEPPGQAEEIVQSLTARGLTSQEAREQYEAELRFAETFHEDSYVTYAPGMKITFGTVARDGKHGT
ncbi:methyltransferase [Gordoniibacillus kamchatkensis]|uniref:Methyltransferase n=1 Tax=Gordoniibacillus kamchatkensis TaxID=1590651 RepID=A0ABR5AD95_9BACL|nr:methyltransferase [Paenibacillus sp. VKM B-2647]